MKTLHLTTSSLPGAGPLASLGQRVAATLRVLHRVNPALSGAGWLHVGLAVAALALLPLDHRLITGAPAWVKPLPGR
jgi:hypothetical protein